MGVRTTPVVVVKLDTAMVAGRGLRHTIERGGEVGHCDCFAAPRELVDAAITKLGRIAVPAAGSTYVWNELNTEILKLMELFFFFRKTAES